MKVRIQQTLTLTDNQVEGAKRYQKYLSTNDDMNTREFIQWLVFVDGMQMALDRFDEFSPQPENCEVSDTQYDAHLEGLAEAEEVAL